MQIINEVPIQEDSIANAAQPQVSAVIPTLRRPQLVLRAVESALNQTFTALEIVVVVDGSDPDTLAALRSVTDPRLRVLPLSESVGGAEARNRGINAARGKWIALLDDDDEWVPGKIEKQLRVAEAAASPYILVFSRMIARFPKVDYIWPRRLPSPGEPMSQYLFCRKGLSWGEGFVQTSSFFASRQMFLEVPFTRNQKKFQDTDWILRASAHPQSRVTVLSEPLVIYYMGEERETVSRKPDWSYLHKWALENRGLFTPRALSFFLATQCVPRAAKQRESLAVFFRLLKDCMFEGSPSPMCFLLCGMFWFIPEEVRTRVRDRLSGNRQRYRVAERVA